MPRWAADFEATTDEEDCRVWAWGVADLGGGNFKHGTKIDGFIEYISDKPGTYYFHNLKYDGKFLINGLFRTGWNHSLAGVLEPGEFDTLISDDLVFYQIRLCVEIGRKKRYIYIQDSFKKLPLSVKSIAKAFKFEEQKGEIDYKKYREPDHELDEEELDYLKNDVVIMAKALETQVSMGHTKMTIGADAMASYRELIGTKKFNTYFPKLNVIMDGHIRQSYRGGYTYCKKEILGNDLGHGIVLDVNSMYPYVMREFPMPVGTPVYFKGKYKPDKHFPLHIFKVTFTFKLKPNKLPCIQIKKSTVYHSSDYIEESDGPVTLWFTDVDWKTIQESYDVDVYKYEGGYKFKQARGLFDEYVDYWMALKEIDKDGKRLIDKLFLNNLYGKFGMNPERGNKYPVYDAKSDTVRYVNTAKETGDPVFTAVACYVTSYARRVILTAGNALFERFRYCDTDSLHLSGWDMPKNITVHPTKLGAWDLESRIVWARHLRSKAYLEEVVTKRQRKTSRKTRHKKNRKSTNLECTCAGMSQNCKDYVTKDNFHIGLYFDAILPNGKEARLRPVDVSGGPILKATHFSLLP